MIHGDYFSQKGFGRYQTSLPDAAAAAVAGGAPALASAAGGIQPWAFATIMIIIIM